MLILALEATLGIVLFRSFHDHSYERTVLKAVMIAAAWCLLSLTLVQWELAYRSPDGTYGSDARYYYEQMKATLQSGAWWPGPGTLSPGYVAWGTSVLRFSPTDGVIWVKMANIGLLLLIVLLGFLLLQSWGVSRQMAFLVTLLYAVNGTVTWMVVRNLKDTLLLFLTVAHIVADLFVLRSRWPIRARIAVAAAITVGAGLAYATIRPWGAYWAGVILVGSVLEFVFRASQNHGGMPSPAVIDGQDALGVRLAALAVLVVLGVTLVVAKRHALSSDVDTVMAYSAEFGGVAAGGLSSAILAVPRFLVGPGPVRALFGWDAFVVTATAGNLLVAAGSVLWWLCLPVLVGAVFRGVRYWLRRASVSVPLCAFIAVYSFAYSGSLDTRFRAVVYVLGMLFTASYAEDLKRKRLSGLAYLVLLVVAVTIWVIGSWESYRSLLG